MPVTYKDYYAVLGIDRNATQDDVRKAYRNLAKKYHPDVNKSPGSEERYKEINEAYEVLKDSDKRQRYESVERGPNLYSSARMGTGWHFPHGFW